jgi:hypothetical protein
VDRSALLADEAGKMVARGDAKLDPGAALVAEVHGVVAENTARHLRLSTPRDSQPAPAAARAEGRGAPAVIYTSHPWPVRQPSQPEWRNW